MNKLFYRVKPKLFMISLVHLHPYLVLCSSPKKKKGFRFYVGGADYGLGRGSTVEQSQHRM